MRNTGLNAYELQRMLRDHGPAAVLNFFEQELGLQDPVTKQRRFDMVKQRCVLEGQTMAPEAVDIGALAHGLLGYNAPEMLRRSAIAEGRIQNEAANRGISTTEVMEAAYQGVRNKGQQWSTEVTEAATDIVPSQFANVSAFNSTVAGLLEAKMLEVWQRPEFIAEQLTSTDPTRKISEKFIGISAPGDSAEERKPGNPHPRIDLAERYVETPPTINHANAIDVTFEAVFFDRTNQLLLQAEKTSETLALRKEYRVIDTVIGVRNTYKYNGTTRNTYQTSTPWINSFVNPFTGFVDLDDALQLFTEMTDQDTGEPIAINAKQILAMPGLHTLLSFHLTASTVERRTPTTQESVAIGGNPAATLGPYTMVANRTYPYAYKRARAVDGLNLSAANATGRWWIGDFKKAFGYAQNWPLTIERETGDGYTQKDRRLIFSLFADEMGTPFVREPRYVIENKAA